MNIRIFLSLCLFGLCQGSTEVTYTAAVLEYEPYSEMRPETGYNVTRTNAQNIATYAVIAKQNNADILVAPEYGIVTLDYENTIFLTYTNYVPGKDDAINPCLEPFSEKTEIIEILSCAARDNSLYLVADLAEMNPCSEDTIMLAPSWGGYAVDSECPISGYYFHNTQIVFDRQGVLIARYRKQHLYLEPTYTPGTLENSLAIFETDFGVKFTLQICFDMLFATPGPFNILTHGIYDAVMSTAWVDLLPFGIADAAQDSWSWGMNVNLLVSGYHHPEKSKMGSGIYNAFKNEEANYIYAKNSGSVMVIGPVTTRLTVPIPSPPKSMQEVPPKVLNVAPISPRQYESEERYHQFVNIDLTTFGSIHLDPTAVGEQVSTSVCSKDGYICCDLTYEYSGNLHYRLLAESGTINVGSAGSLCIGAQVCMVTWCVDRDDVTSCGLGNQPLPEQDTFGPFEINGNFTTRLVFPIGLNRDLLLIPHEKIYYAHDYSSTVLSSSVPIDNPFTLTLFARWLEMDPDGEFGNC